MLGATGVAAIAKINDPRQVPFACIPFIFAVQQACEGMLWLSLSHASLAQWQKPFTYLFLFFAQILWTAWIPVSFLLLEKDRKLKKVLMVTAIAGLCDSLLLGYRLLVLGAHADIDCSHILYSIGSARWMVVISSILYVIAIILPPFFSSLRHGKLLGILLVASLLFARVLYNDYLISVWCFFAALLSVMVVRMMRQFHSQAAHKPPGRRVHRLRQQQ